MNAWGERHVIEKRRVATAARTEGSRRTVRRRHRSRHAIVEDALRLRAVERTSFPIAGCALRRRCRDFMTVAVAVREDVSRPCGDRGEGQQPCNEDGAGNDHGRDFARNSLIAFSRSASSSQGSRQISRSAGPVRGSPK